MRVCARTSNTLIRKRSKALILDLYFMLWCQKIQMLNVLQSVVFLSFSRSYFILPCLQLFPPFFPQTKLIKRLPSLHAVFPQMYSHRCSSSRFGWHYFWFHRVMASSFISVLPPSGAESLNKPDEGFAGVRTPLINRLQDISWIFVVLSVSF